MIDLQQIQLEARKELARRYFYDYCQLMYPTHYRDDRLFLKEMCDTMQWFVEESTKHFLVLTVPPRHYKSFTGTNFIEWYFGRRPERKVISGSYNETLSTTFARKVRDTIDQRPSKGGQLVYRHIFPKTRIKYGQASKSLWALEGNSYDNYLATSPSGTATGFGANIGVIDDIIKNAKEAYNDLILEEHWQWFTNTMMQRTEEDDWKFIIIMTRWAKADLAGRIIEKYGDDVEHISFKAVQDDGTMLCDSILSRKSFEIKTQEMNPDIVAANYNQVPIDVKGRLFKEFPMYEVLPTGTYKIWNYTDTADKGTDFLCSVDYVVIEDDVYILNVVISDADMEETEPLVAAMLHEDGVNEAIIESNNGGRGFARNIDRLLKEMFKNNKCIIDWMPQTQNKEARILASSAWVNKHVFMPLNWRYKWPEFYKQLMNYQKKGKNAHDDAPDVLAAIYEAVANPTEVEWATADDYA